MFPSRITRNAIAVLLLVISTAWVYVVVLLYAGDARAQGIENSDPDPASGAGSYIETLKPEPQVSYRSSVEKFLDLETARSSSKTDREKLDEIQRLLVKMYNARCGY